jgi:hypothetical protein
MSQGSLPKLSQESLSIKIGSIYEHYKGHLYKILAIARHSETLEELVVYQAQQCENNIWVRPTCMFLEEFSIDGRPTPRFKLVK